MSSFPNWLMMFVTVAINADVCIYGKSSVMLWISFKAAVDSRRQMLYTLAYVL